MPRPLLPRGAVRAGFSLVELLVALVLLAIVGSAIMNVLTRTQRATTGQAEQTQVQSNVRAGMMVLASELREAGYDEAQATGAITSDLLALGPDSIRFRAARGLGVTCHIDVGLSRLWLRKPLLSFRSLRASDGLLVFVERDKNQAGDDDWMAYAISAIDEAATCPDGSPATLVTTTMPLPLATDIKVGGPVRFFEVVQFGLYSADGRSWLGAKSISAGEAAYQPVVGPLRAGDGLRLTYHNKTNALVDPANTAAYPTIRSVNVTLRGESERASRGADGGGASEITGLVLSSRIALRNNLRP